MDNLSIPGFVIWQQGRSISYVYQMNVKMLEEF